MKNFEVLCPACGKADFEVSDEEDRFEYGCGDDSVELSVVVPVNTCTSCGYQFLEAVAEEIRHEAICRHLGRMPPAKIVELRKSYGATRADFAAFTGIGSASLARWESGQLIQTPALDSLLYLLLDKGNYERLAARVPGPEYQITTTEAPSIDAQPFCMEFMFQQLKTPSGELMTRSNNFSLHRH